MINFNDLFPEPMRSSIAVASFRANVKVKRPLLESLFTFIAAAKANLDRIDPVTASWLDSEETRRDIFTNPDKKTLIWEGGAHRALYTDAASALLVIARSELDRLYSSTGVSLLERGNVTYVPEVHFAKAILALTNQYKHLGEWLSNAKNGEKDRAIVTLLVDNATRLDASAEFINRGYRDYDHFEADLISCSDNIVTDGTIPSSGGAGIPRITMRPKQSERHESVTIYGVLRQLFGRVRGR